MPQSEESILVTSKDCPQRKPHSDFEKPLCKKKNEKRQDDIKVKAEAAVYPEMVSAKF